MRLIPSSVQVLSLPREDISGKSKRFSEGLKRSGEKRRAASESNTGKKGEMALLSTPEGTKPLVSVHFHYQTYAGAGERTLIQMRFEYARNRFECDREVYKVRK